MVRIVVGTCWEYFPNYTLHGGPRWMPVSHVNNMVGAGVLPSLMDISALDRTQLRALPFGVPFLAADGGPTSEYVKFFR